jgi:hypothetical protein
MFCGKTCGKKTNDGCKAILARKPSALMPLDGLRAIAVLWVFILHSVVFNPNFFYKGA